MHLPLNVLERIASASCSDQQYYTLLQASPVFWQALPPLRYWCLQADVWHYALTCRLLRTYADHPYFLEYLRRLASHPYPHQKRFWLARQFYYYARHLYLPKITQWLALHGVDPFTDFWCSDMESLALWWPHLE